MYIDASTIITSSGKKHTRILLRESYRDNGKVKKRTLANLSVLPQNVINVIKSMVGAKSKKSQHLTMANLEDIKAKVGLKFGGLYVLYTIIKRLEIIKALGKSINAMLIVWLICARILFQDSRLKAARRAKQYAVKSILGLEEFSEERLYEALDWLNQRQTKVENYLIKRNKNNTKSIFLYDVTSCYFEGEQNELSDYGYNRDGKKGQQQIVIGLLTDIEGEPLSIEVFPGNTSDPKTCSKRIEQIKENFGADSITLVGDRGMIKEPQIEEILNHGWNYITAITKAQIGKLIRKGVFQQELFDEELQEIEHDGVRYALKRNPIRAAEIKKNRREKLQKLMANAWERTRYLSEHPKAKENVAHKHVYELSKKLKIDGWTEIQVNNRIVKVIVWGNRLQEESKLDGCYVLKSNIIDREKITAKQINDRYKDIAMVEWAFRSIKTTLLENRPIYCRLEARTKAVCFISMLAYKVARQIISQLHDNKEELLNNYKGSNDVLPLDDIMEELDMVQETFLEVKEIKIPTILLPSPMVEEILTILNITLSAPKAV